MTIKAFPLLLITEHGIEYIESKSSLSNVLFYFSEEQKRESMYIQNNGEAFNLASNQRIEVNLDKLTTKLQQQLAQDGHCCIAKLSFTSLQDLYDFACEIYRQV
ncbi:hypothetical protein [Pseudoalteromonas phenolica]|uniref:hypothetical protein n=1 Tax=Pseudoalteromonas phenolica TaxID=161398 RepID=UPI00110B414B|nr:hypothetical protein [Pseudoalteromonas phenolica]